MAEPLLLRLLLAVPSLASDEAIDRGDCGGRRSRAHFLFDEQLTEFGGTEVRILLVGEH